jgi:cytochrome c-type biogenesis protein CcmH
MSERIRDVVAGAIIAISLGVIVAILATSPTSDTDRVEHLATILKCPFCDTESIASSPADVARELHTLIEEWVVEGRSDDEIIDFFVATYGDEVLLDPPGGVRTALLWILPMLAAIAGVIVVVSRRRPAAAPALDDADHRRVAAALRQREQGR